MTFQSLLTFRSAVLVAALTAALVAPAAASVVLLDRGLPTANLNDTAGSERSNVRWWSGVYDSAADYRIVGDSFTNTSTGTWHITTLRMWVVDEFDTVQLFGGKAGSGSHAIVSTAFTRAAAPALYADGQTYTDAFPAATAPNPWTIYEVDFAVDITLAAGETFEYFFDGESSLYAGAPMLHASNAARSGSAQEGANDLMLEARVLGGSLVSSSIVSWTSNDPASWDKASDFNVLVIGSAVSAPATLALALAALGLMAALRRRA
jgi:hypothetical protein